MKDLLKKLVPKKLIALYYWVVEFLWALRYGFPARGMKVLAITGTKGKSSTAYLAARIFEEAGKEVALLSTIEFRLKGQSELNRLKMTQPGRKELQSFLSRAKKSGAEYVIAEVTSEGTAQMRSRFLFPRTALFTNLSPEHIEAHGGFEQYKAVKRSIFEDAASRKDGTVIVNLDDPHKKDFLLAEASRKLTYGIEKRPAKTTDRELDTHGVIHKRRPHILFRVDGVDVSLFIPGKYNVYNALAAIALGKSEGIDAKIAAAGLKRITGIPGRAEYIVEGQDFSVIVDYAHTPDSLEKFLSNIKYHHKTGRKMIVLGSAGGGRDTWRRPEMGKLAVKYCDHAIFCNEDSFKQDPMEIIEEIKAGAEKYVSEHDTEHTFEVVVDRREAIEKAVSLAKKGDVVMVTGKGTEQKMVIASGPIPWDDRTVAREAIKKVVND